MRKGILGLTAATALLLTSVAACGDDSGDKKSGDGGAKATDKIGVILPDSKSSDRWETQDRPALAKAFDAAGVKYDIQNAQGDKNAFQTIADQMLTSGVKVLLIVNLDSGTGKAVIDKATAAGVPVIDYDRPTLGGGAKYYVSYDNVKVGKLQGEGLVKCLTDKGVKKPIVAELNGSPTDNNATLFKEGYDSVLKPKYDSGEFVKGPDQSVPDWDNAKGGTIFEQMLTSTPKIAGVLAANDGLGGAALAILKKQKLNGTVPVTGQDATVPGLQSILTGDQCMTVFKDSVAEGTAAANLAVSLLKGEQGKTNATFTDPTNKAQIPAQLLDPVAIYKENVKDVITAGAVTKDKVCTPELAKACTDAGIQ
ncbi:sugar ABC transporter substrate-binding protein [Actinocorallia longicatena]|uniref:Substrate-binding domain-containing protein n=1 Tax=Actinocorallia longicatena TaxID=111803 RepID=A0ABP6Q6S8_9ACTN